MENTYPAASTRRGLILILPFGHQIRLEAKSEKEKRNKKKKGAGEWEKRLIIEKNKK